MTRRDYILLARIIANAPITDGEAVMSPGEDMRRAIVLELARVLAAENRHFDSQQFIKDCGFGQ